MSVHIGSIIKEYCAGRKLSVARLHRTLHMDKSTIYRIFSRPDISTSTLQSISASLRHNFFKYYVQIEPQKSAEPDLQLKKELQETKQQLEESKRKIEILQLENDLLNKFLDKIKPS